MSHAASTSGDSPSVSRRLSQALKSGLSFGSRSDRISDGEEATLSKPTAAQGRKAVWLDCDPGHDDAIAMLMAVHHPDLELLGISTVAGNAGGEDTFHNAVKVMALYGASPVIPVIRGSDCPLVRQVKVDVGIHGEGGLGGVHGLPSLSSPQCQPWLQQASAGPEPHRFLQTLAALIKERLISGKPPIHLAVTGPMTNAALFVRCYPHLVCGIEQVVLMGGAAGCRGNRGALAEFNILDDPEAASIVFNTDVKVVMAGLNVTHQAIFTAQLHDCLLTSKLSGEVSPPSDLKRMLSSTLTFFAKTYATEFGFTRGPPVHDMLAIAYIIDPTLFHRRVPSPGDVHDFAHHRESDVIMPPKRYRVDVECADGLALGATVVDFWGDRLEHQGWGRGGKNVEVLEILDSPKMWDIFFQVVDIAEAHITSSTTGRGD